MDWHAPQNVLITEVSILKHLGVFSYQGKILGVSPSFLPCTLSCCKTGPMILLSIASPGLLVTRDF